MIDWFALGPTTANTIFDKVFPAIYDALITDTELSIWGGFGDTDSFAEMAQSGEEMKFVVCAYIDALVEMQKQFGRSVANHQILFEAGKRERVPSVSVAEWNKLKEKRSNQAGDGGPIQFSKDVPGLVQGFLKSRFPDGSGEL